MKTAFKLSALVTAFIGGISQYPVAFGQGTLAPLGAPATTMKSLAQIEPRIPLSSGPFVITVPGSYYLTTNVTALFNGIVIATNGVTLDLGGWTIFSSSINANGTAIFLVGDLSDITILNGHIRGGITNNGSGIYSGTGFGYGIRYSGNPPVNVLVSRVSVSGCLNYGIYLNTLDSTVVEGCTVRTVGGYGILASTVKSCGAVDCGDYAIYADQASDCRGETAIGSALIAKTAQNCYGASSGNGFGITAQTAQNCYGYSISGSGLNAQTVQNCYGFSDSGTGLSAQTAQNSYGFSLHDTGLHASRNAINCYGYSQTDTGLYAFNASFCTGDRLGGAAIRATIATGCIAYTGTNVITYKYNMP